MLDPWFDICAPEHKRDLEELLKQRHTQLQNSSYESYQRSLEQAKGYIGGECDLSGTAPTVSGSLSIEQQAELKELLEVFIPWKKGPFNIFGEEVDSEWRSDIKWDRFVPHLGSLKGKVIADIGCHNGYFMFRMAEHQPSAVYGFEPVAKNFYNFQVLNSFFKQSMLHYELLGVEHTHFFPNAFDSIFCLGILYHHTDPIGLLRKLKLSLRKGGSLFIDCQGIAGDDPVAYVPQGKYAGARGIWFLPTLSCLTNWIRRAGFQSVEVIYSDQLDVKEQRASSWAPIKSLSEFLTPCLSKTIEGHPAPHRFYLKIQH